HQANRLQEAMQAYQRAIQLDASYFDPYYNLGLAASQAGNTDAALAAYEAALTVRPESLDSRYNFALALQQANYHLDAARELDTVLKRYPNETRVHLALGNLYAQQLSDPAKARQHYLRVLATAPHHPQAGAIRYWLADHP
ncbi:MAG TPA: tetratricopeptide repeat protein, partial [Clostridia bacterium]|nr:tetratricopeptide repeat protein [Clostridia bacterium]